MAFLFNFNKPKKSDATFQTTILQCGNVWLGQPHHRSSSAGPRTATARAGRQEGRPFFTSSCKKSVSILRVPHEAAGRLLCGRGWLSLSASQGCQLLLAHPWLQGISRDFSSSTDFLVPPKYRVFKLRGLCLHVLIRVLSVLLERLARKHCDMGAWFPLQVKCEVLSLKRMLQY